MKFLLKSTEITSAELGKGHRNNMLGCLVEDSLLVSERVMVPFMS